MNTKSHRRGGRNIAGTSPATKGKKGHKARCLLMALALIGALVYIFKKEQIVAWHFSSDNVYGIDLSRYQNDIDWANAAIYYDTRTNQVAWADSQSVVRLPIQFVFIKATQGTRPDSSYNTKRAAARANRFRSGAYHVMLNDTCIETQAEAFARHAQIDSCDFPPILDIENQYAEDTRQYRKKVLLWLRLTEEAIGARPIIYCSDKTRENILCTRSFNKYHFWIARYGNIQPKSNDDWLFWQFTDHGRIAGYKGKVDISRWKGTQKQLERWRALCWQKTELADSIARVIQNSK